MDDHFFEELDFLGILHVRRKRRCAPRNCEAQGRGHTQRPDLRLRQSAEGFGSGRTGVGEGRSPIQGLGRCARRGAGQPEEQLRNLSQYTWMSGDEAANYLLAEKIAPDEALIYVNKSIENEDRYDNELTKSKV